MGLNKFFQSKNFTILLMGVGALAVLLLVFKAGVAVGFRKANFSYQWGENYHRNFAGPRGGFLGDFRAGDFIEAHGVFGQIIKVDQATGTSTANPVSGGSGEAATLVIRGRNNVEKTILVKGDTIIKFLRDDIRPSDLKTDYFAAIIGAPNSSGQIEAKLIRIFPTKKEISAGDKLNTQEKKWNFGKLFWHIWKWAR